jgi:formate hydrogenlyase transcriptional activator
VFPLSAPGAEFGVQRQEILLWLAELAFLRREPVDVLREIALRLRTVLSFDSVDLALCDPGRKIAKMHTWEGLSSSPGPVEVPLERSVATMVVWRNQTILSIDDLSIEKQFELEFRERGIRSYSLVPLTTFHEKLGALGIASKRTHAFNGEDIRFLQRVADLVALCIDTMLADAARDEEAGRQRLLLEVGHLYMQSSDLHESLSLILRSLQKWVVQGFAGFYLYDETSQFLRLHMLDPEISDKMAPGGLTPIEGTFAGQAFRDRHSVVLDHSSLAKLPFASVKRGVALGVRSLYLSPLLAGNEPLGVLKVARRVDQAFSARDVELLEQVASTVALLLDQARRNGGPTHNNAPVVETNSAFAASAGGNGQRPGTMTSAAGQHPVVVPFSASRTLMESEQLLSAYYKASRVGLCILDTEFCYLAINDSLAEINGAPATAILGKSVREVLGGLAELVLPPLRSVLTTGEPILDIELSFVMPNSPEPRHWTKHIIPIKDETGKVIQIGSVVVEITDQKRLEESFRGVSASLRSERKWHEVLAEVSRVLEAKWDAGHIFPRISASLRRVLRQEYAALAVHDEKSGQLIRQAMDFPLGKNLGLGEAISTAHGPGVKVLQQRSPLIFSREQLKEFDPGFAATLSAEGLRSLCCVPLLRPKGPRGVLVLGSTRADAFKTDDLTLLNQVAALLAIALENARTATEIKQLRSKLDQEKQYLEGEARPQLHFEEIIGEASVLKEVLAEVGIVAPSDATVLILGETGTGKGLVARAIHNISRRAAQQFVPLNCAAIPTGLMESELFGHEKGAFTGAVSQKVGRLELADKGTLFLDEIGEIPLELQPKLLRVLQDHEFERLGGTKTIRVDLRLIAATNRDLTKSVANKEFRSDLFYRLNVFPVRLPSLRERRGDIPLLVRYFVQKFARRMGRVIETIPTETMDALTQCQWPGNVRELENFIERSVILTTGTALRAPLAELRDEPSNTRAVEQSLEHAEREHIIQILRETEGRISGSRGAARRLGLKRTTLQSKMQRLGITRADYIIRKPKKD